MAVKSNELMELSVDNFFNLINDEMLNVKDEAIVWQCCLRWIDHDVDNRKQHVSKLLRGIRLGLMNTKVFTLIFLG